ncbi:THO complex subunit 5A [Trifolium repens]|nr:THO complex subunit 5A [Trifolium repens]
MKVFESLDAEAFSQRFGRKFMGFEYGKRTVQPVKLITIKFEYMVKLNIVCVGIEGSNDGPLKDILCNLFPNDTRLELPHQSAKLFVQDATTFNSQRTSRPYKWVELLT